MARSAWLTWPPASYQIHAMFGTNPVPEWVAETVSVTAEAGQTTKDVKVSAVRGGFLEVTVLGKLDRKPLADVSINAFKEAYQAGAGSETNGVALLRLPPGEYQVSAYKDNSRSEPTAATVESGRTNRLEIELNPPPKITGVVRDASGKAVPDLQVSVFPNWGQNAGGAKTDAKGHYEMPGIPNGKDLREGPFACWRAMSSGTSPRRRTSKKAQRRSISAWSRAWSSRAGWKT